MLKLHLPEPEQQARQHSEQLQHIICQSINHNSPEPHIDFARFMDMALYQPGLGYYSAGLQKFGPQGDFITAPEISPLFAQTLANPVGEGLQQMERGNIIELGAGSGRLAVALLKRLQQLEQLPERYFILELSASLQQRQQQLIQQQIPELQDRIHWLDSLPEQKINAIVIANEVLDAMPVQRFTIQQGTVNKIVVVETPQQGLQLKTTKADDQLTEAVRHIENDLQQTFNSPYQSEINFHIQPWLAALSNSLNQAAIFLIDYGYHRKEYYSPARHMGTLMCYYQHRSHDNALRYPGLQDITAFVDFTALAEAALDTGFDVDGYTSQGNFLLASGLPQLLEESMTDDIQQQIQLAQQVKTLTLPSEMGERFKVMALSKNLQKNITGFELRDFRDRL